MVYLYYALIAEIVHLSPHIAVGYEQSVSQDGLSSGEVTTYTALLHKHILYVVCKSHAFRDVAPLHCIVLQLIVVSEAAVDLHAFYVDAVGHHICLAHIQVAVDGSYGSACLVVVLEASAVDGHGLLYGHRVERAFAQGYNVAVDGSVVGLTQSRAAIVNVAVVAML